MKPCIILDTYVYLWVYFTLQPNPDLENALGDFHEVPDHDSKIFSPCHMQMMQDYYHNSTVFGSDNNGDIDIASFLDSILATSDECSYEDSASHPVSAVGNESPKYIGSIGRSFVNNGGSGSESDVELLNGQVSIIIYFVDSSAVSS